VFLRVLASCRVRFVLGTAMLLAAAAAPSRSAARVPHARNPHPSTIHNAFQFSAEARHALRVLWRSSVEAKQERVACIGGHTQNGVAYVTRVQQVAATGADSLHISAVASLRECSPPTWLGTVHTHIAHFEGRPYALFSRNDRVVMAMWRRQWKAPGVFCILYSDREANCEAGYHIAAFAPYDVPRGNSILP
jgi:hypothetical protein